MSFESQSFRDYPSAEYLARTHGITLSPVKPMYASRRSQFKSIALPKRTYKRPAKYTRKIRNMGRRFTPVPRVRSLDPSVQRLNGGRPQTITVKRTNPVTQTILITSATGATGGTITFDPSGTFGNVGVGGTPLAMPDWSSFKACFDYYRVNGIKLTWTLAETAGTAVDDPQENSPIVYYRYNYESSVVTPSLTGITQVSNCMKKVFTPTNPMTSYNIVPKVLDIVETTGSVLASQSYRLRDPGWIDVNLPAVIYGFQYFIEIQLATHQSLQLDVEYDISFKYGK